MASGKKEIKAIGHNVMFTDNFGTLTPINSVIYKDEKAILAAFEKGDLTVPDAYAGFSVLPVYQVIDAKEPKATAKPDAKTSATPDPKKAETPNAA